MIYEDQFVTHDEANSYVQSINALLYFEVCSLDYVSIENRFIYVYHVFFKKKLEIKKLKILMMIKYLIQNNIPKDYIQDI